MKIVECTQRSPEWYQAKLGMPSASGIAQIITPTGKPSEQAEVYADKLLAEILIGHEVEGFESLAMVRGREMEAEAALAYEAITGETLTAVGFCISDDGMVGCSPDRLVGEDGLLEIKCPEPHTHVRYLLTGLIDKKYYPQVQCQLLVTGREWCDWMSFHPEMPPSIIRVKRDVLYQAEMCRQLFAFHKILSEKKARLISLGHLKG